MDSRSAYPHWHRVGTQWADNDIYGHVNNTVHYRWFDTAVNTWLIANGLLDLAGGDRIGLVVESGCRYAAPLAFPDEVEIGLKVVSIGNSSVEYQLGAFRAGDAQAAAQGRFVHVYVDRLTRRPTPLPAEWRQRLMTLASPNADVHEPEGTGSA